MGGTYGATGAEDPRVKVVLDTLRESTGGGGGDGSVACRYKHEHGQGTKRGDELEEQPGTMACQVQMQVVAGGEGEGEGGWGEGGVGGGAGGGVGSEEGLSGGGCAAAHVCVGAAGVSGGEGDKIERDLEADAIGTCAKADAVDKCNAGRLVPWAEFKKGWVLRGGRDGGREDGSNAGEEWEVVKCARRGVEGD